MTEQSSNLALPCIQPSQAQKHVTHNETLRILFGVPKQGCVESVLMPPVPPVDGIQYTLPDNTQCIWARQPDELTD